MDLLILALVFIFGAIVGSFLNVCIARLPAEESLIHPPSHCPACHNYIRFYDNIPLISYVLLKRRCRSCGEAISPRYFVVELLMASFAVGLYYEFGLSVAFFAGFIFVAAMIVISFIDLDLRIIPNVISIPGIAVGLGISLLTTYVVHDSNGVVPSPLAALIGVLSGGGFLYVTGLAYEYFTGTEGMGGGDVKLLAMIGAFWGWPSVIVALFAACLVGSIVGLTLMIVKRVGRKYPIPFGPFLALGALLYLFFADELLALYFPAY
jgi:leader peptidase (prepilin peptidase)/N-methyltransferase